MYYGQHDTPRPVYLVLQISPISSALYSCGPLCKMSSGTQRTDSQVVTVVTNRLQTDQNWELAQAALCAPPKVAFAMRSGPLLIPSFSLSFSLSLLSSLSFAFYPLWGNYRGWKFVSPNILAKLEDIAKKKYFFFVLKKIIKKDCIYILVMAKYWRKQIFSLGSFPEVGKKQKM